MTAAAPHDSFREIVVDVAFRPMTEHPLPVSWLTAEEKAAELQHIRAERARLAAREADVILGFAADRPDDDDPPAGHPGARSKTWRKTDPEFPGISESFPRELAIVLGVGRGTAVHKLRRAWTLRHGLPRTEAAQRRGELDERRVQILADTLASIPPALAGRVEAIVLPEAGELGFGALERRILDVLLELDPESAEENRKVAEASSDVFLQPGSDGRATLGAELNADEAAEAYEFLDTLAREAKKDGDQRPIGQLRTEIYSLLVRGAAVGARGPRASLTITAALEALEGANSRPGEVNGVAITPAHLAELLRRVGALGLRTPTDGSLTFALTDADGALLATLGPADLQRAVRRGEGASPPAASEGYTPTAEQREFIDTRDRTCRMPLCGQRTGWADHDHVVAHSGRRRDDLHESLLLVPQPPPAQDAVPGLAVRHGARRHPARHHTVGRHPHQPAPGPAPPATTRTTTLLVGWNGPDRFDRLGR